MPCALSVPLSVASTLGAIMVPCLWDRDTLRSEAEGSPQVVDVLTGRFDRFPDAYYEHRIALIEPVARGAETPGAIDLAILDDLGVACDRLHRADEAIAWMELKRLALDARPIADPFHEYSYLANLGTFYVHRWLRAGRDQDDLADVERARDLIAAAIDLNPDAHFGRERLQLLAIESLLDPPDPEAFRWPCLLHAGAEPGEWKAPEGHELDGAIEGLAGLVHLGDAWESAGIWWALTNALSWRMDSSLARMGALRVAEIVSARPEAAPFPGFELESMLLNTPGTLESRSKAEVDAWYARAREAAEAWRASRSAYIAERIAMGEHPDTHPGFWNGWQGTAPAPRFPGTAAQAKPWIYLLLALAVGVVAVRSRRGAPPVDGR